MSQRVSDENDHHASYFALTLVRTSYCWLIIEISVESVDRYTKISVPSFLRRACPREGVGRESSEINRFSTLFYDGL